jgi:hypothetical protein
MIKLIEFVQEELLLHPFFVCAIVCSLERVRATASAVAGPDSVPPWTISRSPRSGVIRQKPPMLR